MTRLLVVCRHFWPSCSEAVYRLVEWTDALAEAGVAVTLLTARWHHRWPAESAFRRVRLVRLLPAPTSNWNDGFFLRNLWQWVERHRGDFDSVYLDSLSVVPPAKFRGRLGDTPLAVRFDAALPGDVGGAFATGGLSPAARSLLARSDIRVVVDSARAHRGAVAAGAADRAVVRLPQAVWHAADSAAARRSESRKALAQINRDFFVPDRLPLLVCFFEDRLPDEEHGFLKSLRRLLDPVPQLRCWVFGAGDSVRRHYSLLKDMDCHHDVLLHAPLDQPSHLLRAADLVMCPAPGVGRQYYYSASLAAGTPLLTDRDAGGDGSRLLSAVDAFLAGREDLGLWDAAARISRLEESLAIGDDRQHAADRLRECFPWAAHRRATLQRWLQLFAPAA